MNYSDLNGIKLSADARSKRLRLRFIVLALVVLLTVVRLMKKVPIQRPPLPLAYAYVPSPNCDDRPLGAAITCVVLHATVESTMESTIAIFLDPARRVSAHFIVGKDGRVVQMTPVELRAWHAGPSVLDGVGSVNDYSVGIEMVNRNDGRDPYPEEQIQAVAGLVRFIRSRYSIPDERIVSHAHVALPPGRKSDPAGFDFGKLRTLANIDLK